jgi:hypothetical protein
MIYLTYDTEEKADGLGSQYHRVLATIALSKVLDCEYLHNPISKFEHSVRAKEAEFFFNIDKIYRNVKSVNFDQTIKILNPTIKQLLEIDQNKKTLVKVFFPFGIIEGWNSDKNYLETYDHIMPELRQVIFPRKILFDKDAINIAIHIRRNDVTKEKYPKRYVPTKFYVKLADELQQLYKNSKIHIFTDERNLEEFKEIKYAKIHSNIDVFESFYNLSKADILVTAPSSFSILAGLYSESKVYYIRKTAYNKETHGKISRWEEINPNY